jgi:hypothetical protein
MRFLPPICRLLPIPIARVKKISLPPRVTEPESAGGMTVASLPHIGQTFSFLLHHLRHGGRRRFGPWMGDEGPGLEEVEAAGRRGFWPRTSRGSRGSGWCRSRPSPHRWRRPRPGPGRPFTSAAASDTPRCAQVLHLGRLAGKVQQALHRLAVCELKVVQGCTRSSTPYSTGGTPRSRCVSAVGKTCIPPLIKLNESLPHFLRFLHQILLQASEA